MSKRSLTTIQWAVYTDDETFKIGTLHYEPYRKSTQWSACAYWPYPYTTEVGPSLDFSSKAAAVAWLEAEWERRKVERKGWTRTMITIAAQKTPV